VPSGQRLAQLAAAAAGAPTPRAALRHVSDLRRELDAFERRQVAHALAEGASFAAIARDLGISRQAVHRKFRDLAAEDMPLLTAPEVQRVLRNAREEAAALDADELDTEHIVLGVLRARDLPAATALEAEGATLERARSHVEGASSRTRLFRRAPGTGDIRLVLEAPVRHARARGGRRIEVEDLLLGAMEDPDGGAVRLLRALGIRPDAVRERLTRALGVNQ
jgi:transposase-like protein